MFSEYPEKRSMVIRLIEALGRIACGEPARIVRQRTLERLERSAYREHLEAAERRGDLELLREELAKVQLTKSDLDRLAAHETPIEKWPDEAVDVFTPREPCEDQSA